MNDPNIDRYCTLRDTFRLQTGRNLQAYAVVGIDDKGELYWGASWADATPEQVHALRNGLSQMMKDMKEGITPL